MSVIEGFQSIPRGCVQLVEGYLKILEYALPKVILPHLKIDVLTAVRVLKVPKFR